MEKTHDTPVPSAAPPKIETPPPAASAAKPEDAAPAYVFPDASRGAVTHVDKATGTYWIGFKLTGFDYQEAVLFLDAKKLDILRTYRQIAAAMEQREAMEELMKKDAEKLTPAPKRGLLNIVADAARGRR